MNPKNDLSTIDRIEKLLELESALKIKLDRIVEEKVRKQCVKNDWVRTTGNNSNENEVVFPAY